MTECRGNLVGDGFPVPRIRTALQTGGETPPLRNPNGCVVGKAFMPSADNHRSTMGDRGSPLRAARKIVVGVGTLDDPQTRGAEKSPRHLLTSSQMPPRTAKPFRQGGQRAAQTLRNPNGCDVGKAFMPSANHPLQYVIPTEATCCRVERISSDKEEIHSTRFARSV